MSMFYLKAVAGFFVIVTLTGCGGEVQESAEPAIRPVKIFTVQNSDNSAVRKFPGRVEASQRAELAFRVGGTVSKILVKEGDQVKKGKLLAQLDKTDFQITVQDRQATFDNAKRNFERAAELIESGSISRLDYDRTEANFKTSQAALAAVKQDLAYTNLEAPFAGQVARRYVESFEQVQAKQEIFSLQGINILDVVIDLPEVLVRNLQRAKSSDEPKGKGIPIYAEFEGQPGSRFPLTFKEVATKAHRETQTFQVRLTMPAPEEFTVLPGMTTNVTVDLSRFSKTKPVFLVPSSAVDSSSKLEALLWVLDADSMTVSGRKIRIGRLTGNMIEVLEGLEGNEEVVSVGTTYVAEGMRVSRMIQSEQAAPVPMTQPE